MRYSKPKESPRFTLRARLGNTACWPLTFCLLAASCSHEGTASQPSQDTLSDSPSVSLPDSAKLTRHPINESLRELTGVDLCQSLDQVARFSELRSVQQHEELARKFLIGLQEELRLNSAADELEIRRIQNTPQGSLVRFDQRYRGLAVWPAELSVQLDANHHVVAVKGDYVPTPKALSLQPKITSEDAVDLALKTISDPPLPCPNCKAQLALYVLPSREPRLAFEVQVAINQINSWQLFVDANDGTVLFKQPTAYLSGVN